MTRTRVMSLICAALALSQGTSHARLGGAGTTFLAMGGGVRGIGMGAAVSSLSGDVEAVFWNPAGIAPIRGLQASFTHTVLYADMSLEDAAVARPALGGVVGVSALAFLSGRIRETTEEMPDGTGETFSANALALSLTYARMMTDKFSAGASLRVVHEGLADVSARGWGFDLGGTYHVGWNVRLGFAVANFGPDMRFSGTPLEVTWGDPRWEETQRGDLPAELRSEPYPMPMTFRAGISYGTGVGPGGRLLVALEGVHPVDQPEKLLAGVQYSWAERFHARVGYNPLNDMTWTAGAGVVVLAGELSLRADYSYQHHRFLEGVHRIGVGVEGR